MFKATKNMALAVLSLSVSLLGRRCHVEPITAGRTTKETKTKSFSHRSQISFTFVSLNMASSSPSVDLPTQLEYYAIRDTLLGHNNVKQDVKRALELASTCQHPDA